MTNDKSEDIDMDKIHRQFAVKCFNGTWDYLDKKDRTPEDNRQMLILAHTSRYHWNQFSGAKPSNLAVGDWQVSRVYAELNQPDYAIIFAESSLKICLDNQIKDYNLASSFEGVARAHSVAGNKEKCQEYLDKALKAADEIKSEEDKKVILDQINSVKCK
jgi:tetratricopeptide (TPR) repeat protein